MVGAAFNDGAPSLLPNFLKQYRPPYPIGLAERLSVMEYMQLSFMQPGYVPYMAIIDRKFVIREQHGGEEPFFKDEANNLRKVLNGLLAEGAPAAPKKGAPAKNAPAKKKAPAKTSN